MFGWESEKERLLRHMKIPPKKKLEWLRQMEDFITKYTSKNRMFIRKKLRQSK